MKRRAGRRDFLKAIGLSTAVSAVGVLPCPVAAAGSMQRKRRPNIILIVSDEHQAAACGCYGSRVRQVDGHSPTPAIDALAAEGVRFDSMYCASPLCAPSRAAYMTGIYPHSTTAIHHKMQRREPGLSRFPGVAEDIRGMGEYFREAGYRTAAIGKMHVHGEDLNTWDMGFEERDLRFYTKMPGKHYADLKNGDVNRRYREMRPYINQTYHEIDPKRFSHAPEGLKVKENGVNQHFLETLVEHEDEMLDHLVTDQSLSFIGRNAAAGQPFFIHVGLEKPHRPWTIHQRFLDRFHPDNMPLPETIAEWKEKGQFPFCQSWCHSGVEGAEARRSMAAYYACAVSVDDCVARIVARCRELGILDNTVLIYTSDHGENLYEHGLIEKHNMLDPAARVPFVISAPWLLPRGEVRNDPASLIDMLPTFCELSGVQAPPAVEGVSLLPAIEGRNDPERMVFSEFYQEGSVTRPDTFLPVRMGLNARYKYVYTHAAADQLYLRGSDDEERLRNRAFEAENEALVSKLRLCTLDGWELDEYPQLSAAASVTEGGVALEWEDAGAGARYDVYRSADTDPRNAERIAAGLKERRITDATAAAGRTLSYWVLGHPTLDHPFTDFRGNRRFGDELILSGECPYRLPVTLRLEVTVKPGWEKTFSYEPLLGLRFGDLEWIRIGMPPRDERSNLSLTGPVTLLSSRAVESDYLFGAEVKTERPGYKPEHTLMLLLNYHNMHRYYLAGLQKDGTLGLWKRTGEWKQDTLASRNIAGLRTGDWHRIEVKVRKDVFVVSLDGKPVLEYKDPEPLPPARFGFEAPLHLGTARLRDPRAAFQINPWDWKRT